MTQRNEPILIFNSYAHEDESLHDELHKHLKPLEREGLIRQWYDRNISAGKEFGPVIDEKLEGAGIILLLVSPDFVASDYCWSKEMLRAIERHRAGEAVVIPVILRPVDWLHAPFGKLLALPKDGKPVTIWPDRDTAFLQIAEGIRRVVSESRQKGEKQMAHSITVRSVIHTTNYVATVVEIDISNATGDSDQIIEANLLISSLGVKLSHAPGPSNLHFQSPYFSEIPFEVGAKRLTRGCFYFRGGAELQGGLPTEPLTAELDVRFFLGRTFRKEIEIYTLETIRNRKQSTAAAVDSSPRVSSAAKFKTALEQRAAEREKQQRDFETQALREAVILKAAPKEFERLAEVLRSRGEAFNAESIQGAPTLKFEPMNRRLDAGTTFSIELSPYAQIHSYTLTVRVGLHPNAQQSHAELPRVQTIEERFQPLMDGDAFFWIDHRGRKWTPEAIVDTALDRLTELLTTEHEY